MVLDNKSCRLDFFTSLIKTYVFYSQYEEDKEHIYSTEVSYLEIYNDSGFDLLDPRHEATKLEDLP